jgi:hypothetical protein
MNHQKINTKEKEKQKEDSNQESKSNEDLSYLNQHDDGC